MVDNIKDELKAELEQARKEIAYYKRLSKDSGDLRLKETEELSRLLAELKKTEKALQKSRDELEKRVEDRTAELSMANLILKKEISERKEIEKALRKSEQRFRSLAEITSDWIWEVDQNGFYSYTNPKVRELLGYEPLEIIGKKPFDFMSQDEKERISKLFMDIVESGKPFSHLENVNLHKDGRRVVLESSGVPFFDERGYYSGYRGIDRDITDRKQAEEALLESEALYRTLAEKSFAGVYVVKDGKFCFINQNAASYAGYTQEEMIGRDSLDIVHPDDRQRAKKNVSDMLEGRRTSPYEFRIITKQGNIRWIMEMVTAITYGGGPAVLGNSMDISERIQAEEERKDLDERLQRAQKMETLGLMAGGVAHDLNNVLGVFVGYAELLLLGLDKDSPLRGHVKNILNAGERAGAIVQDMLALTRRGVHTNALVNLNKAVMEHLKSPEFMKLSSSHPHIRVRTELDEGLLSILGSPTHLAKSLMNLIANALEAMPSGGDVVIRTNNCYLDKPVSGYDAVKSGDYVTVSVSDEGEGISDEDMKRIFEPFYTRKVMGRSGTGLGLAMVWGTVKDHKGYIDVQSEKGKGTTFTLYFPVAREKMDEDTVTPVEEYGGRGENILVVDDVAEQRELATQMLTKLGYHVSSVSSGEEAVAYLKEHDADLIVLDMIMDPGIDGFETYRQISEIRRKQKAIIVSGYAETERVKMAQRLGAGAYVRKPYIGERIGLAIRRELDK